MCGLILKEGPEPYLETRLEGDGLWLEPSSFAQTSTIHSSIRKC